MSRSALIAYNPAAGSNSLPESWLGKVVHELATRSVDNVNTIATAPETSSQDIIKQITSEVHLLVAAGGDGTVRMVLEAAALSDHKPVVGIIPVGTGNQLARNLHIYEDNILVGNPLEKAIKTLITGEPRPVDLGIMNGNYFAVAAGAGPMSDAIVTPEQRDKANWKMLAYASSLVQTLAQPPVLFEIEVEGETLKVAASGIFVTNIADFGVGTLSESASLNDGLLDLCILSPEEFQDYVEYGFAFAGALIGNQESPYYIKKVQEVDIKVLPVSRRGSVIQNTWRKVKGAFGVYSKPPLMIYPDARAMVDGDACGHTPMHVEVAPSAVQILTPKTNSRS